jgi:histidinol dehydrogenase
LNTEDFLKKITFEYPTREGLEHLKDAMVSLADYEGFPAHRNAILRRFEVR